VSSTLKAESLYSDEYSFTKTYVCILYRIPVIMEETMAEYGYISV